MSDISGFIVDELRLIGNMQYESSPLEGSMPSTLGLTGQIDGSRGPQGPPGPPGPPGTTDYEDVINKPSIGGITLIGNKTFEDLGLIIDNELDESSSNPIMNSAVFQALEERQLTAGNGITIINNEIALDNLVLDCGTSTTVI